MLKLVLNLFFPPVCGICGKLDDNWLCDKCNSEMKNKRKSLILKQNNKYYNELAFEFLYEDIRTLILQYKFNNKAYLSNTFVKLLLQNNILCDKLKLYDIIIPVPMSKNKKANRGYNQTELISKKIAEKLNIEYKNKCLIKNKTNKTQSSLKEKQRFENVKDVFGIENKNIIKNKNVIIFDDIVTTGATVNECAKVLKKAGAKTILVLAIAKD